MLECPPYNSSMDEFQAFFFRRIILGSLNFFLIFFFFLFAFFRLYHRVDIKLYNKEASALCHSKDWPIRHCHDVLFRPISLLAFYTLKPTSFHFVTLLSLVVELRLYILTSDMGLHYVTFMGKDLVNRKEPTPI